MCVGVLSKCDIRWRNWDVEGGTRDHRLPGSSRRQVGRSGAGLGSHTHGATHGSGKTQSLAVPIGKQKFDTGGFFHLAEKRKKQASAVGQRRHIESGNTARIFNREGN